MGLVELHAVRPEGGPDATPDGPTPLVLVHGLASNARLWDGVARAVAAAGHPVVAVDLRGHGRSPRPPIEPGAYTVPTVAADLVAFVERWCADGHRPLLAGQSYGGTVVLEAARALRAAGTPVAAVGCVDGGFLDLAGRHPRWEDCAAALAPPRLVGTPWDVLEARMRSAHPDWPEAGIAGAMACFERRADGTIAPWLTFEHHLAVLRGMWEVDVEALWGAVVEPVLLLLADDGTAWSDAKAGEAARCLAALADGRLVSMDGDHDLHAQQPDVVAELLLGLCPERA